MYFKISTIKKNKIFPFQLIDYCINIIIRSILKSTLKMYKINKNNAFTFTILFNY